MKYPTVRGLFRQAGGRPAYALMTVEPSKERGMKEPVIILSSGPLDGDLQQRLRDFTLELIAEQQQRDHPSTQST